MEKKIKERLKNIGWMILFGIIGGVFGCQLLLPWLGGLPLLNRIDWLRQTREGVTIINRTEKITISEDQALQEVVTKGSNIVVGVVSEKIEKIVGKKKIALEEPEILWQGSGLVVTSDGLIVTTETIVPESSQEVFVILDNRRLQAEIKKRDKESGSVLLRINENNLSVASFIEGEAKLGEKVFLLGVRFPVIDGKIQLDKMVKFVDLGIAKEVPDLKVDFTSKEINGTPLFNIKGEVLAVSFINAEGQNKIINSSVLKNLIK